MTHHKTILLETRGDIVLLTLNRPHALNALNSTMLAEVVQAAEAFDADPSTRVMIVTGGAKAFAAGADIKEVGELGFAEAYGRNFSRVGTASPGFANRLPPR